MLGTWNFLDGRIIPRLAGPLCLGLMLATVARADRIELRGGGSIQGIILPDESEPDEPRVLVLMKSSSRPLTFRPEQILEVIPEDDELREYLNRRDQKRTTGEQEYQFGLWCERNGLTGPAQIQFRKAVELDPDHAEANKKLGHVLYNGQWMTYDEKRERQGLIHYKGRWISAEEKEEIDAREEFSSEQREWTQRLKHVRRQWRSGDPAQQRAAEALLVMIRDPAAVRPLVHVFGADPEPVRVRLAEFLAAIPGPESTDALIRLVLSEANPEVREATLVQLRNRQDPNSTTKLRRSLGSSDPVVVGRAAVALAELGDIEVVPKLVPLLVKVEKRLVFDVQPSRARGGVAFSSIGPGPFLSPGGAGGYAISGGQGGAVMPGYVGGGSSIPILTGPAVAPGAIAFGATSVPFGAFGAMIASEGANPNRPVVRVVTEVHRNSEVLRALVKLTGQDFRFDANAWKRWLRAEFRPQPVPPREVPQP